LLILTQTARRGLRGGLLVMLGANLTLLAILVALAVGLSAAEPSATALRVLRIAGGIVLVGIAANELRTLVSGDDRTVETPDRRWDPTVIGIVAVLLNPGAWLFFATTASSVLATVAARDDRTAAVVTAVLIAVGVSASDLLFSVLGSGGRRLLGDTWLVRIRGLLAVALAALGVLFVWQGVRG
jgi:threonine/homoserine/homoserine lactone efflux protein